MPGFFAVWLLAVFVFWLIRTIAARRYSERTGETFLRAFVFAWGDELVLGHRASTLAKAWAVLATLLTACAAVWWAMG
jgi:hypothetical protein